jgi:hypothetical protein
MHTFTHCSPIISNSSIVDDFSTHNYENIFLNFHLSSTGLLSVLCVCGVYIGHYMPAFHPCAMAVLRRQHLRVGPVCVAYR